MPCPDTPAPHWRRQMARIVAVIGPLAERGAGVPDLAGLLRRFSDPPVGPIPAQFQRDRQDGPRVEFVPVEETAVERRRRRELNREYEELVGRLSERFRLNAHAGRPDRMPWEPFHEDELPA